ncbi:MobF family relaxase [Myceligenerans pegani]|uniref:Relaxase domain-containing protein n=1 Tax=Myceligenerans pegani TaxID=2776917 RepID=A0ABR9MXJ9_9MICO|nr:MobF family relaxase [Myceligenerans sp. TRM 65318]MBE1876118.1 relaxase domain-containing protein [Myceligenerans sp. TRM 65318]MBE3018389.1 relaxase domain-containing protein [Myceligenerans sp. TRM 65318]
MTVSIRKMGAGDGYKYLLRSVAQGDADRLAPAGGGLFGTGPGGGRGFGARGKGDVEAGGGSAATRYYTQAGTPPGEWIGSGVQEFGAGQITAGDPVMREQMELLFGQGRDPVTGRQLGRRYPSYRTVGDRIADQVDALDPRLPAGEREEAVAAIVDKEMVEGPRTAVAGFDLTFSVPKSISILWALADPEVRAVIQAAHRKAMVETVALLEREVAVTRMGTDAGDGAVSFADVQGVAATAFDHWDSRSNDPQLHTHVVIANRAKTGSDGRWRTLDSMGLHRSIVALSEHYNAVLADRLTAALGVSWDRRNRGADRTAGFEIEGVPEELIRAFSGRSRDIDVAKDELRDYYVAQHGREPSRTTMLKLRGQATLATRPPKRLRSLEDLMAEWRERAGRILGQDATAWTRTVLDQSPTIGREWPGSDGAVRVDEAAQVPQEVTVEVARRVLEVVSDKRATWRRWNLWAEAERQTLAWRITPGVREQVVTAIVSEAEARCIALTPPELASTPVALMRRDGTSSLRPKHATLYTSQDLLDAEARLLKHAVTRSAPTIDLDVLHAAATRAETASVGRAKHGGSMRLDAGQAAALASVATSGRRVDLLVGPAGAGKTTAMRVLKDAWTHEHGPGSVIGLAPSAAAAENLAGDLGIGCENTAKWLYEHRHGRASFQAGDLVIIDEATLAGTRTLDRIVSHAAEVGAKVLLVGDWAQLQAVNAGGAFSLLVQQRDDLTADVPELVDIHRFRNHWEKAASLRLRRGDADVASLYERHGRLHGGDTDTMLEAAYTAWKQDVAAGLSSILIADTSEQVRALNERAQAERLLTATGRLGRETVLHDGTYALRGETVITRRNRRDLRDSTGRYVRNGDRWTLTAVHRDGSVKLRRHGYRHAPSVTLPAGYAAEHLELGYAVTTHRAQGITVDSARVLLGPTASRENAYVALTRGREANHAYIPTDQPDPNHTHAPGAPEIEEEPTPASILARVLRRPGAEPAAHQARHDERERWTSIRQIAAEYDTIATDAQRPRWTRLVGHALVDHGDLTEQEARAVVNSDAFGVLAAELRRSEANGHDVDDLMPRLVADRGLHDADDVAAVLHYRLRYATGRPSMVRRPSFIAGLIPAARGPLPDDARQALDERAAIIEQRAHALAEHAIRTGEPWTWYLPPRPTGRGEAAWLRAVVTIAAYRDKHQITSDTPLGDPPTTIVQRRDAERAAGALRRAQASPSTFSSPPIHESGRAYGLEL